MNSRRHELGEFMQVLRNRSQPADFGFASGSRRRTPGLRREEMAQLIDISPTWYTWIEQGREVNVSAEVLDRLARTLRLTRSERAYLFEMADRRDPDSGSHEDDDSASEFARLLPSITVPAYIMGRYWDMLGWNEPAAELFHGWLDQAPTEGAPPNMLRFVFLRPETRAFLVDWETRARRITAEFRADCRTRLDDPPLLRLVAELSAGSADFTRFWKQHDVLERQGGERRFAHPRRGQVCYRQTTLKAIDQDHLKLVMLQPQT